MVQSASSTAMRKSKLPKWLLTLIGIVAVSIGAVGIVLPLVPTTPLVLLAAACFCRSSDRLYHWLMNHRWAGPLIRSYREHHAVPLRAKLAALVLLWLSIGSSVLFAVDAFWLRALLVAIAVGVTIHIIRLKTLDPLEVSCQSSALRDQPSAISGE